MSEKPQKVFTFSHFRALSFTLIDNHVVMKIPKIKKGARLDTLKNKKRVPVWTPSKTIFRQKLKIMK